MKRIGILTITPSVGYGGIMQAYALQTVIENISGAKVQIINYQRAFSLKFRLLFFIKKLKDKVISKRFVKFTPEQELKYRSANTNKFIEKHLHMTTKVSPGKDFSEFVNRNFDVVIVGSDQVWRPDYVLSIYDYYFYNIGPRILKIAYAASLGDNNWRYNEIESKICADLLNRFTYVSLREQSAIPLLQKHFNYGKQLDWVLDPTLLLNRECYLNLFDSESKPNHSLFTYILDNTIDKEYVLNEIINNTHLELNQFSTNGENYSLDLKDRIAPPVEEWLKSIYNSSFVFTDSFHGCVFAIIFNKPFIVYANKTRGADRFESILNFLGLQNRLLLDKAEYNRLIIEQEINWKEVNKKISVKSNEIINHIGSVLNFEFELV